MNIEELYVLKAKYEQELLLAQARVSVISDIIERAEAKEQTNGEVEVADTEYPTPEINRNAIY